MCVCGGGGTSLTLEYSTCYRSAPSDVINGMIECFNHLVLLPSGGKKLALHTIDYKHGRTYVVSGALFSGLSKSSNRTGQHFTTTVALSGPGSCNTGLWWNNE